MSNKSITIFGIILLIIVFLIGYTNKNKEDNKNETIIEQTVEEEINIEKSN